MKTSPLLRAALAPFGIDADQIAPALDQLSKMDMAAEAAKFQASVAAIPAALQSVAARLATVEEQNREILARLKGETYAPPSAELLLLGTGDALTERTNGDGGGGSLVGSGAHAA